MQYIYHELSTLSYNNIRNPSTYFHSKAHTDQCIYIQYTASSSLKKCQERPQHQRALRPNWKNIKLGEVRAGTTRRRRWLERLLYEKCTDQMGLYLVYRQVYTIYLVLYLVGRLQFFGNHLVLQYGDQRVQYFQFQVKLGFCLYFTQVCSMQY